MTFQFIVGRSIAARASFGSGRPGDFARFFLATLAGRLLRRATFGKRVSRLAQRTRDLCEGGPGSWSGVDAGREGGPRGSERCLDAGPLQELGEADTERVDVGARVGGGARALLRRRVGEAPLPRP